MIGDDIYKQITSLASDEEKIEKIDSVLKEEMYSHASGKNVSALTHIYLLTKGAINTIEDPDLRKNVLRYVDEAYTYYRNFGDIQFGGIKDVEKYAIGLIELQENHQGS